MPALWRGESQRVPFRFSFAFALDSAAIFPGVEGTASAAQAGATDRLGCHRYPGRADSVTGYGFDQRVAFVADQICFRAANLGDDEAATVCSKLCVHQRSPPGWLVAYGQGTS